MRATELRISHEAVAANARALRARVPDSVKMMCVVKADAYGHGAARLAPRLEAEGLADGFAVAIAEEAAELRAAGVRGMVLILGGACEESLREAVRAGASQAVYDVDSLGVLADEARRLGVRAKAHLKADTGMSRIGVRTMDELDRLLARWKDCPEVEMEGMFTHFSAADTDPAFTAAQSEVFSRMLDRVRAAGFAPIAHAAASSAMLDPKFQYDMVRAGIGLYGCGMPAMDGELRCAQTLVTRPIRIETIQAGDTVGYGRTFCASRETAVMTLPIGYGDGYPRILGGRADVLVHGRRAPVIGRVCMDMLMAEVSLDDEVVLLGRQGGEVITPDELAGHAETISYEIMLGFLPRVARRFVD